MSEKQNRLSELQERIVKTPDGNYEHQIEDTKTGEKASVSLTAEDLTKLFATMITEIRKPDAETQRLKDEADARRQENIRQMIAVHTAEQDAQKNRWANCSHKKERGESAWVGQPFSNGMYQAVCLKCNMMSKPVPIHPSMMSGMA